MAPFGLTAEQRKNILISVGTHRSERALSPVEVARLLQGMIDRGATQGDIGKEIGIDAAQVGRFLSLLHLPADIQDLVDWGRLSDANVGFSIGVCISRLEREEDQRAAIAAALEHGLTKAEAEQVVQARKRSGRSIHESVAAIIRMRPQIEVRHVFLGVVQSATMREQLRAMSQQGRDGLLRRALGHQMAELAAGGRLGPERFSLAGTDLLGEAIRRGSDALEARVNAALLAEMSG